MAITLASLCAATAAMAQTFPSTAAMVQPPPGFDGLRPVMATHTVPPYPYDSVRLKEQGTAMIEVHITTEGAVDDCKVVQSSSSERLDNAACDHVKAIWRWQPPTAGGQPVAVSTRISVKFDLEDILPPSIIETTMTMPVFPAAEWKKKPSALNDPPTTLMRVRITNEGASHDCTVVQSSGSALLDQIACGHVTRVWRWTPAVVENPPEAAGLVAISWDAAKRQAVPFRLTVGALLTSCASQEKDVVARICDPPLLLASFGVLLASFMPDHAAMCEMPTSVDEKKDLSVFKEKILGWMRDHPEVRQDEPLVTAHDNAAAIFACQK